ncbi:MAG: hypothetical protein RLZZ165_1857 [Bacteroidota bacterium]|jgi:hypothetical protein
MAHQAQASEELKPFRLGGNHTRKFGILAVAGIVLFLLGIVLSTIKLPTEEAESHASAAPAQEHHQGTGADAGQEGNPHAAKGEAHATGHAATGHVIHDTKSEGGTWRRAEWHEEQEDAPHLEKEVTMSSKVGVSLLIGVWWWLLVALFGIFFISIGYAANAGWYIMFKRVLENYYRYLPIGAILLLVIFFAWGKHIYQWYALPVGADELIDGKRGFLNVAFILGTGGLLVGIWAFFGHLLRKNSLAEEAEGGLGHHQKSMVASLGFLPVFAFGFSAFAFLWIMSVDPHWFSTIFAVYCFAGMFVAGMTVTMFITTGLKKEGYLPDLSADHLHDIGKFMFAFSIFWAYIWLSQYLLIWYANIPEETIYYYNRFQDYKLLFALNLLINFFFPFIALMTRDAKRKADSLRATGRVMLFGRFLDVFLLLVPGALGGEGGFHVMLMAAGAVCVVGAVFLYAVYSGFNGLKMEPRNHPYYEESLHHTTGV